MLYYIKTNLARLLFGEEQLRNYRHPILKVSATWIALATGGRMRGAERLWPIAVEQVVHQPREIPTVPQG